MNNVYHDPSYKNIKNELIEELRATQKELKVEEI